MAFGFIKKAFGQVGSIMSGGADDAAREAAGVQSRSADRAIAFQRETRDLARGDLQPFRDAGVGQLNPLVSLISDPNAQLNYVRNNPFFNALADDAQGRLFSNQAARGKVGSGGTAEALQNSLLLLGQNLLNQNIQQRQNLVTMGQNAAAGQATVAQNTGNSIADLITSQGNAQAAGIVGAANARASGIESLTKLGATYALSDRRFKRDIERIGTLNDGIPVYRFRYEGSPVNQIGVMADEVEKVHPEAVIDRNGVKFVNYDRLGMNHAA